MYEVCLTAKHTILFGSEHMRQEYASRHDFETKANIDGRMLKDIWQEVTFAGFMYCG